MGEEVARPRAATLAPRPQYPVRSAAFPVWLPGLNDEVGIRVSIVARQKGGAMQSSSPSLACSRYAHGMDKSDI